MQRWQRFMTGLGLVILAAIATALLFDRLYPVRLPTPDGGIVVTDRHGTPLRTWPDSDGIWRYPLTPQQVSPLYVQALLAYEDRAYAYHPGINPWSLARAAWQWWRHGRIVSGGSTLTMQVARLIDPSLREDSRHPLTKLRQILRALQLELHYGKSEILTLYLNHAPMGGIMEGVEMASRSWLGKPAAHLTHAEAALLVALPQAPSRLRLDRHPQAALRARDKVLERMAALGVWSPAMVADARLENIIVPAWRARWLAPLAAERLQRTAGAQEGIVASTLDTEIQTTVVRLLRDRVAALPPHVSMAALVMHNDTLALHAYVGAADFANPQRYGYIDMTRAVRSPGSTLKPFLYALALDEGLVHSESLLVDAPMSFGGYRPGNFQAGFTGPVSVSEALANSLNVPAVDLLDRLGPVHFAASLRAGGIRLRTPDAAAPNLSLVLGGGGTTLHELVGAYRALARGGMAGTPRLDPRAPRTERRLMSAGAAYIVRDILESGGHPARPFQGAPRKLAWKTGTSFGFRDAWAVGVTDAYTVGVWVGRPDGTPNPGYFGANIAAPLLADIAAILPAPAHTPRPRPAEVGSAIICWPLGLSAKLTPTPLCAQRRTAWTLHGATPPTLPDRLTGAGLLHTIWIDPDTGLRTTPRCTADARSIAVANWPVTAQPWLSARGLNNTPESDWLPGCQPPPTGVLRIDGLTPQAILRPAAGASRVQLELKTRGGAGPYWWLLDGRPVPGGTDGRLRLLLHHNGEHSITVLDANGEHHSVVFEVRGQT